MPLTNSDLNYKAPLVGIWWFYKNKPIFAHSVPVPQGEHYGTAITGIKDHTDYWEELRESGKLSALPSEFREEYFSIPRGRVVYHEDTGLFTVYHGNNISKKDLQKVLSLFKLPKENTRFEQDIHYCDLTESRWNALCNR